MLAFKTPSLSMGISEIVTNIFRLWLSNLNASLKLSLISALIMGIPHLFMIHAHLALSSHEMFIAGIIMMIINFIPVNALYVKLGHAVHHQAITFSQAIAGGLIKLPRIVIFYALIISAILLAVLLGKLIFGKQYLSSAFLEGNFSADQFLGQTFYLMSIMLLYLIISLYLLLVIPAIIIDNLSVFAAIKKSYALMKGYWWFTGVVLSVPLFVSYVSGIILKILAGQGGWIISQAIFIPLNISAVIMLFEYHRLRMPHE